MIPPQRVQAVEEVRTLFLRSVELARQSHSLRSLLPGSALLRETLHEAERVASTPRLNRPCDGRIVCAVIGASGHGKTTFMSDLFPGLGARGWLVTEKNDTTSQSLRVEFAADEAGLSRVEVHSWDLAQIVRLVDSQGAREQNEKDGIRVEFPEGAVVVDGSKANFKPSDRKDFRFGLRQELRPLPGPYTVPVDKLRDRPFIRSLTIKELPEKLTDKPVVTDRGHAFNALQLRTVVKDVTLHDPFDRVATLCGVEAEAVKDLVFVDTPGLATASSLKDEVLRHCLEQKSNRIVLELWKDDDLDVIVHLVLCGEQSNFATLWKAIEAECGPNAMSDLSRRLVLVINGMNIYFNNPDLSKKFLDPEVAAAEGDHFATTVVDNVLQKMSPRGRVNPAKVCFVDSQKFVGSLDPSAYKRHYEDYRTKMLRWVVPGGVGRETLDSLGLVDDFRKNIDALCDPVDRGQGFLLKQIHEIAITQGPALLARKYLKKTGLYNVARGLRAGLHRYYHEDGTMSREAVAGALKSCLGFLKPEDPWSIEKFAKEAIDPGVSALFDGRDTQSYGETWVVDAFRKTAALVRDGVIEKSRTGDEVARAFGSYYEDLVETWADRWGYATATLSPPTRRSPESGELVKHGLKLHGREIVYQLVTDVSTGGDTSIGQDPADRRVVAELLQVLAQVESKADQCRDGENWS